MATTTKWNVINFLLDSPNISTFIDDVRDKPVKGLHEVCHWYNRDNIVTMVIYCNFTRNIAWLGY